jgi:hypothetical protein
MAEGVPALAEQTNRQDAKDAKKRQRKGKQEKVVLIII